MSEMKPCPFCGGAKICTEKSINLNYCDNCSAESNVEHWNTRPIEDALNKRIAELSQAVGLITTLKPTMVMDTEHPLDMAKEVTEYVTARIAELKESDKHWAGNVKVCMQLIERYESAIAELEEKQRWIPVSERLPGKNDTVLVFSANESDSSPAIAVFYDCEWTEWIVNSRFLKSSDVTHWMPLPESPNDTQKETFVYGKDSKPIPCPFCGEIVKECNDVATPIDVALRKRIAELEGFIGQLIKAGNGMKSFLTPYVDGFRDSYPATSAWESLVKDWKEG